MTDEQRAIFSEEQRLKLHQLRILEWMDTEQKKKVELTDSSQEEASDSGATVPKRWELTKSVSLYDWQKECIENWFKAGHRGTVKVVTGAGKTILGLAIAERIQNTVNKELRVAIVVPTVVLMHQWYDAILEHGNLPARAIARLGGGYKEDLKEDRRIIIAVLASARKQLATVVRSSRNGKRLLLIADECHRAGAALMSNIFETERAFSLGLSATPEREDDEAGPDSTGYEDSLLAEQLGQIIYDFTLAQALALGIVPPFTIRHYGLQLTPSERSKYEQLSRSISDTQSELRPLAPLGKTSGPGFFQWLRSNQSRDSDASGLASRLISDISRRQALVQSIHARANAAEALLRAEFSCSPDGRAILFHESIAEVMALFLRLQQAGFRVIAEHSRLPDSVREEGLELFRKGIAQVIVSAKSLIEGFNVPAVDVGIIVASSGSIRQRIQSLGRVLRRHRGPSGEEKTSSMHILYAQDTVDEMIYAKTDWERATGVDQNIFYTWDVESSPVEQGNPPRSPLPSDEDVDATTLKPGDDYLGEYEGAEFSCDMKGNIQHESGIFAKNPGTLPETIISVKGSAGRFRITPSKRHVLVRVSRQDDWATLYVRTLEEPLDFSVEQPLKSIDTESVAEWIAGAQPGTRYPFEAIPISEDGLRFKAKRGGVICKRVSGGEVYARTGDRASDPGKGQDAAALISVLLAFRNVGVSVSQLLVNEKDHVLYREGGKLFFVYALKSGLEFPE